MVLVSGGSGGLILVWWGGVDLEFCGRGVGLVDDSFVYSISSKLLAKSVMKSIDKNVIINSSWSCL